jgi:hypothetical protein
MLSLSANGEKDGILWAAIHATGDSWHESRPGILHAYAADDIGHELWNSLENAERDDCGEYSKMAPPTIANGKVYLASFGTENVGTGQFCVYGLLPDGAAPSAPAKIAGVVEDGQVALSWEAVPGARTYTVKRAEMEGGPYLVMEKGLVSAGLTGITQEKGTRFYVVTAVSANGESVDSAAARVEVGTAAAVQREHTMVH